MTRTQIIILAFISLTILSCESKTRELKSLAESNKDSLQIFCDNFLKQSEIWNICIASSYDKSQCDAINSWSSCSKKWETWSEHQRSTIYLFALDQVLTDQKIEKTKYDYYANFLKRNNLKAIGKVWNCPTCIDLEYDLEGLRYSQDNNYRLEKGNEYLTVEQIDPNWSFYHRDWN
jgi:hypothetical protein